MSKSNVVALGRGDFFAVDRRLWAHVFDVLGLHAAVAYLVMARGAGGDNRTTSWSAEAVNQRTGLNWRQAKNAIDEMVDAGVVLKKRGGSKPSYFLVPPHNIKRCEGFVPPPLTPEETALLATMRKSRAKDKTISTTGEQDREIARRLVSKGYAVEPIAGKEYSWFAAVEDVKLAEAETPPEWIWLPNALVDGVNDETPPVELTRQSGRPAALRLLVELYGAQRLTEAGGVPWRKLREKFERIQVGQQGACVVWGFQRKSLEAWPAVGKSYLTGKPVDQPDGSKRDPGWDVFWNGLAVLRETGLLEYVEHVIDADHDSRGGILHPYAWRAGEPEEKLIGQAAHKAGHAMLTPAQSDWARDRQLLLLPAPVHLHEVQMVGIARLRYRACTTEAARWIDGLSQWAKWSNDYEKRGEEQDVSSAC